MLIPRDGNLYRKILLQLITRINLLELAKKTSKANANELNDSEKLTTDKNREENTWKRIEQLFGPKGIVAGLMAIIAGAIGVYNLINPSIEDKLIEADNAINTGNLAKGVTILQGINDFQDSQWRVVKMLAKGITMKSHAPDPLNVKSVIPVPPEVKEALDIIKGRTLENDRKDKLYKSGNTAIDLRKTNLHNIDFIKANLANINLSQSSLLFTNLSGADLKGAYLRGTYLRSANLIGADLENVRFDSNLQDKKGHIVRTDFIEAELLNANLNNADFYEVKFFGDNLNKAELAKAKLNTKRKIKGACNWHLAKRYSPSIERLRERKNMGKQLDGRDECKKFISKLHKVD